MTTRSESDDSDFELLFDEQNPLKILKETSYHQTTSSSAQQQQQLHWVKLANVSSMKAMSKIATSVHQYCRYNGGDAHPNTDDQSSSCENELIILRFSTNLGCSSGVNNPLFLHLQYHPKGISRKTIQQTFHNKCLSKPSPQPTTATLVNDSNPPSIGFNNIINKESGCELGITKITVAYSQPKNLRDLLCPTKLIEFNDINVQNISPSITK